MKWSSCQGVTLYRRKIVRREIFRLLVSFGLTQPVGGARSAIQPNKLLTRRVRSLGTGLAIESVGLHVVEGVRVDVDMRSRVVQRHVCVQMDDAIHDDCV